MTDKEKIEKLKPFDFNRYENVDLDHLAVYAISQLEKIGADLSFENGVVAIFKLFPKKFSLLGFPSYPDSLRVYTCLWRCTTDKKKLWLGGKVRQGFIITNRSRIFITEAEKLLCETSPKKMKATSQTRRKELLIAELEQSPVYSKYMRGQRESISEAELCYLLQGTLDSSRQVLRENLALLKKFATELERENIIKFLCWLEDHFKNFLNQNNN
ncbi:MAG: hypothetical protein JRF31_11770 [Deltaproteobacteria bacterium]|nr:hypothetical protein [Deltaproteobacteria bacterium]